MTNKPEMNEGSEAFERFRKAAKAVIGVRKSDLPPRPTRGKKKKTAKRKA